MKHQRIPNISQLKYYRVPLATNFKASLQLATFMAQQCVLTNADTQKSLPTPTIRAIILGRWVMSDSKSKLKFNHSRAVSKMHMKDGASTDILQSQVDFET